MSRVEPSQLILQARFKTGVQSFRKALLSSILLFCSSKNTDDI